MGVRQRKSLKPSIDKTGSRGLTHRKRKRQCRGVCRWYFSSTTRNISRSRSIPLYEEAVSRFYSKPSLFLCPLISHSSDAGGQSSPIYIFSPVSAIFLPYFFSLIACTEMKPVVSSGLKSPISSMLDSDMS